MQSFGKIRAVALVISAAAALAGCAVTKSDVDTAAKNRETWIAKAQETITTAVPKVPVPVTRVRGNYLGGQVLAVSNSLSLPAAARDVVLNCGAGAKGSLEDVAAVIRRFTGMSVRIATDVSTASSAGGAAPAARPTPGLPLPTVLLPSPPVSAARCGGGQGSLPLSFSGDLSDYLNQVTAQLAVHWEYVNGEIHIYRRVTRVFTLMLSPGGFQYRDDTNSTSSNSSSGNATTTVTGNFGATSSAQTTADYRPWDAVDQAVKTMISSEGKYTVNQSSGTLVVTDTEDVVDRIGAWVKAENSALTRQVAIEMREISVQMQGGTELGIDVNLVFQKLNAATGAADWVFRFDAPSSLADSRAGSIGYNIAKPTSRLSGSNVAVQALNTLGTVVGDQTRTVVTTNRVPGRLVDVTDRAYLAATTPSSSSP